MGSDNEFEQKQFFEKKKIKLIKNTGIVPNRKLYKVTDTKINAITKSDNGSFKFNK